MKTVITQKIEIDSIPSPTTHGRILEHRTAIAVLEIKGELVPRTSQQFDGLVYAGDERPQLIKKIILGLTLVLGTTGILWSKVMSGAIMDRSSTAIPVSTTSSPISTLASISSNLGQTVKADDGFIYPLANFAPLTSPFGWRVHPISRQRKLHSGVDFEAPYGAPIVAAISGAVVMADWDGGHGKTVVIERAGRLQVLYAHMSKILVQKGQVVVQGEVIGHVGSTGRSTGDHLHFETLIPGKDKGVWVPVDPAPQVQSALGNFQTPAHLSQNTQNNRFN